MILALDVGNTQIYGGVFDGEKIKVSFRKTSKGAVTSDELGIFLKQALRENDISPESIKKIGISSVVPEFTHSLNNCCKKYFNMEPFFISAETQPELHIKGRPATGLGADRVANAVAAMRLYPKTNLIVIDFGTANTYCAISARKEYKGGAIQVGLATGVAALADNAAQLSMVGILKPAGAAGLTTATQMQSGVYYSNLGAIKEIAARFKKECFPGEKAKVILTGGLGRLFEKESVIDAYEPDLVLRGIKIALEKK